MKLRLTPDTKLSEVQDLLDYIHQEYGDDTASIEIFSDLSAVAIAHHDREFAETDDQRVITIPHNNETHEYIEDGY